MVPEKDGPDSCGSTMIHVVFFGFLVVLVDLGVA